MTGRTLRKVAVAALAMLALLAVPNAAERASADGTPPTVDESATLSGPASGNVGSIVTYVMSITNNGPDQALYLQVTLRWDPEDAWHHPDTAFDFVDSDPANICAYTPPTIGNIVASVSCGWSGDEVGSQPLPAGTTRTVAVRLRVLAESPSRVCAAAEAMQSIQVDPNPANDFQCLDFAQESSSPPPAPTPNPLPPSPVAPSTEAFSFVKSLPHGAPYVPYNNSVIAPEPVGYTPPADAQLVAGALPPGLTLSNSGDVTGRPTTVGTFTFTVAAGYDDISNSRKQARFTLVVDSVYAPGSTVGRPTGVVSCHERLSKAAFPGWVKAGVAPGVLRGVTPYVLGVNRNVAAVLVTNPLLAPARTSADAIVWVVRNGARSTKVKLRLQRMTGRASVGKARYRSVRSGRAVPLDLPAGCWRVALSWGSSSDTLDLRYAAR